MNYANPETFDAFRFFNMRAEDKESVKSQFVPLGLDWVTFGIGRHAWSDFSPSCQSLRSDWLVLLIVLDDSSLPTN